MLITNKNDYGPMRAAEEEAKSSEGATAEGGKLLEKLSTMGLSNQAESSSIAIRRSASFANLSS